MPVNRDLLKNQFEMINQIKKIWTLNSDEPKDSFENKIKYSKIKAIIEAMSIGKFFVYVMNLHSGDFEYISPSIEEVLGYKPEEFTLDLYIKSINPEDLPYLVTIQKNVSDFTMNVHYKERMQYKYCYDYRVKDKEGNEHQLYIQHFYPELSANYNPQRAYCFLTDITHIKIGGIPKLNIFKLNEGFVNILNEQQEDKISLTSKESEIFEFLVKGFTSQDIADALGISKHTVDTHRRNILKRNNCSNTSELLSLYFETKIERK